MDAVSEALSNLHSIATQMAADVEECRAIESHQCAWCNRFYLPNGQYIKAPFIVKNVSHGICHECYLTKMTEIKEMRKTYERS